ncbi:MAG: choline dehydrogenase [Ardenticatenales bacterium]|nr:choline dehydrogenase [Ardenticatenales bacterium]
MYDYIIVGAGAAGCVLANRLSADPGCRVLLLEAGPTDRRREIHIPAAFSRLFRSSLDWGYETEPEPALNGRQLYWPRGKVLGGSTSINAMIYQRGHPAIYDQWAAAGNPHWRYADILPYFKRAENQTRVRDEYHGVDGPMNIVDPREPNPLSRAFVYAGMAAGLRSNPDFNGAAQEGVGFYQLMQRDGQRQSAAAAYLKPILDRPNLTIITRAQAMRILFTGKRAVGILYHKDGCLHDARAHHEVILSSGAINSPQLLLLSGIGPAESLRQQGIQPLVDLPGVGQNLQDHLALGVIWACPEPVSLAEADSTWQLLRYLTLRQGPLASNLAEAGGFVRTQPGYAAPDLQFHFVPGYFRNHGFDQFDGHCFTLAPTLVRVVSTGAISLRSANPQHAPIIQANYLSDPSEMATLVAGVRLAREIIAGAAFDPYRGPELHPGPASQSVSELEAFVRQHVQTLYHPVGTCKMGQDPQAVVDAELRVHGVMGLRVIDASIMPTIVNANTHAPTVMIAEKGADMIRQRTAIARIPEPVTLDLIQAG